MKGWSIALMARFSLMMCPDKARFIISRAIKLKTIEASRTLLARGNNLRLADRLQSVRRVGLGILSIGKHSAADELTQRESIGLVDTHQDKLHVPERALACMAGNSQSISIINTKRRLPVSEIPSVAMTLRSSFRTFATACGHGVSQAGQSAGQGRERSPAPSWLWTWSWSRRSSTATQRQQDCLEGKSVHRGRELTTRCRMISSNGPISNANALRSSFNSCAHTTEDETTCDQATARESTGMVNAPPLG